MTAPPFPIRPSRRSFFTWSLSGFLTCALAPAAPREPRTFSDIYRSTCMYINYSPLFPIRPSRPSFCTWSLSGFPTSHTNTSFSP